MTNTIYTILFLACFCTASAQVQVHTLVEEFNASGGVKVNSEGDIIVADFGESLDNGTGTNVWKVTPEGDVSLYATGLFGASGNDFDSEGNLFQSNIAGGTVSKITPDGNVSQFVTSGISCNVGIVADPDDNIYVCNCCGNFGNTIRKVNSSGISTSFSSGFLFNCPNGITIDKENNLYVSNFGNGNIIKITPDGNASLFAQTPGTFTSSPSNGHIVYSPQEDILYVASHGSHRIYRLDMEGNLEVFAGSSLRGNQDGPALEATFSRPNGLALSLTGDMLYVNSSIPTTDIGGRPLNPSTLRMITGLLQTTDIEGELSAHFEVKIAPNPILDIAQISFEKLSAENMSIKLLNSSGQLLQYIRQNERFTAQQSLEFSFDKFPRGLYYLQFETQNQSFIRKVVY